MMLETACELHVDRTLLVGTKTTLRVTDRSGEPQARASIYAGETLLGKTGPDGTLKYTFTTTGLQTLHAVSSAGRSQNASAVVCDKPYVNEGLPFGVQNNAVAGASTAQSITWLSSIDSSAEKALVRYAEKADMTGAMEFTGTVICAEQKRFQVADGFVQPMQVARFILFLVQRNARQVPIASVAVAFDF